MSLYYIEGPPGMLRSVTMDEWRAHRAKRLDLKTTIGGYLISTVWLGLDHAWGGGPPLIYETMVFDHRTDENWRDLHCQRYTWADDARVGHEQAVQWVRDGLPGGGEEHKDGSEAR